MKRWLIAAASAGVALVVANAVETTEQAANRLKPDKSLERAARELVSNLPQMHLSHKAFDENVSTNALKIYLDMLDYEHSYFLASDIERFKARAPSLIDELSNGRLDLAFEVYTLLLDRVSNRVAYVDQLLKKGFDLDVAETYAFKRKDAPYAKDEAEWNDLWRRRIKNQIVARKVSDALGTNAVDIVKDEADKDAETHSAQADSKMTPEESIRKSYERLYTVLKDNDATWVSERYLNSFTMTYDPHTSYMTPLSQEDFEIGMNLSLVGIGALLSSEDGAAKVERLIPGGPAERDGRLKPGDKVIAVGQGDEAIVDILHYPLSKAVRLIRGKKGSKVVLKYIPVSDPSGSSTRSITIVRDEVKLEEQAAKGEIREIATPGGGKYTLGIVTLPEFYADMRQNGRGETEPRSCTKDVLRILEDFRKKDVEGVALDLRNNGGGSLSEAIALTGLFIPTGPVVQVRDLRRVQQLPDENESVAWDGPLVVLVNRFSASASEILAGALQDYGRAVVVGDSKTHGKGTVQSLTNLSPLRPSLGSLKVTTASFYRIAGGSTQLKGVAPDIVISSTLEALEVGEEYLPNAMPWSTVAPANYPVDKAEKALVPELRKRSEERRAKDPKFAALQQLTEQVRKQQQSKEITLRYSERLELARADKELQKQLEESAPEKEQAPAAGAEATDKDKKKKNDLVLNESLNILADWIDAKEQKTAGAKDVPAARSI